LWLIGAAGGPAGSVIGAGVGALAGAVAGGIIGSERSPAGGGVGVARTVIRQQLRRADDPSSTTVKDRLQ